MKDISPQASGARDGLDWRTRLAVPDPLPKSRGIMSKQHTIRADAAVMRNKCEANFKVQVV